MSEIESVGLQKLTITATTLAITTTGATPATKETQKTQNQEKFVGFDIKQ